jgi:hypothetical protein
VSDLNPTAIQNKADELNASGYKLIKSRPTDDVVKCLAAELTALREKVPLLQEVRNISLQCSGAVKTCVAFQFEMLFPRSE